MASDARKPSSLGRTAARSCARRYPCTLPRFGKFDALAAKTAGPHTQENFSPRGELQRRFCGCKISSYFFPNADDLTPPAHTTQ